MSSKKSRASNQGETVTAEPTADNTASPIATQQEPQPLQAEIAAFLAQREELARKIADEIAATEQKLADLKKHLALLQSPAAMTTSESPAKDRKPKKPKPKTTPATEPPAEPAAELPPTEAPANEAVA